MRSDVNYQQEIDSSMTTHDSINLLMYFLKLEISEELWTWSNNEKLRCLCSSCVCSSCWAI